MNEDKITIADLIMEFFYNNPKKDLTHGPVVDYVEKRYMELYGKKPRDPWRQIRKFHQEGILIKVKKGVYKYDPEHVKHRQLYEFPPNIKEEIFKRDGYKCILCGKGREDGIEIHADHKTPLDENGTNDIDNGQTLCSEHNFLKKTYSQTEFGKRFINKLYKDAVKNKDEKMINFCKDILDVYDKHKINGHIKRANHDD
ncbi:MAG TPA: HNH endonuclease signature motif containing protein [Candidatus Hydrogenedens sp.]|nr:HNH endonuclease signature motif containing protein [Candidatus Hydrogenedens sp.]